MYSKDKASVHPFVFLLCQPSGAPQLRMHPIGFGGSVVNDSEVVSLSNDGGSPSVIAELIGEVEQFIEKRSDLFKAEIRQKLPHLLNAARLGIAGGLLLLTGYLFLAIAVVVLIGSAFPQNPYRWFFGFLIVGIISAGFGAIGAFLAKSEFDLKSILPHRTLSVLQREQDCGKSESRQQK
jgi:hypothetical protein